MAPPWSTNPAPKTESAREARKAFYCDLCQKGYSRINELEAHEGSYDHTHKKRLKDLKHLTRASDATYSARARKAEEKAAAEAGGGMSIKPITFNTTGAGGASGSGFKKGGFRKAFGGLEDVKGGEGRRKDEVVEGEGEGVAVGVKGIEKAEAAEEEEDEDGRWGDYDPRRPTGCGELCRGRGD